MCSLANSLDPDEMPHNAAFHQGLCCLLQQKWSSKKEKKYLEIITHYPSTYSMDRPKSIISNQKEESISA